MNNKQIKSKYMMATKAIHLTGDISRDKPDLCVIFEEDDDNYIGNWVTGFGFINVKFPKNTTRDLTPEEVNEYHGAVVSLSGNMGVINITGENFRRNVILTKKENGKITEGTLIAPLKVGSIVALINYSAGTTFHTSGIESINGNEIKTKNSTYIIEYLPIPSSANPLNE